MTEKKLDDDMDRFVRNRRIIQFLDKECNRVFNPDVTEYSKLKFDPVTSLTCFAIVEDELSKIVLYTYAMSPNPLLNFGEVVTTIKVEGLDSIEEVIHFCTTDSDMEFKLCDMFFNSRDMCVGSKRYCSMFLLTRYLPPYFEIEPDDVVVNVIIPGKSLGCMFLMILKFRSDEITRHIYEIFNSGGAAPVYDHLSIKVSLKERLLGLIGLSRRSLMSTDGMKYDMLNSSGSINYWSRKKLLKTD